MNPETARAISKEYRNQRLGEMGAIGAAISERVLALPEFSHAKSVMAFCPVPKEPDITPLLREILRLGKALYLPRCEAPGVMTARRVTDLDHLAKGAFGIPEPGEDCPADPVSGIDLVLLPCAAAGESGERVGKGGGYYDRFLEGYLGTKVVLSCDALIFGAIATKPHDVFADIVVSEARTLRPGKSKKEVLL